MADTILIDPLGRRITLHDRTWFGHILRRHSEMNGWRSQIGRTVERPMEIRFSTYDPDCRTCYSEIVRPGMMIAVVIDVKQSLVRTAFFTTRMKGAVEWSQPTP